jgi:hypothetical protein
MSNTANPAGTPIIKNVEITGSAALEQNSEFENFEEVARKVVAVPKKEVDEKRGKKDS